MTSRKFIFFIATLFLSQLLLAQDAPVLKISVDKNTIVIGQPIQLTVELFMVAGKQAHSFEIDSLGHFEILDAPVFDTIVSEAGKTIRSVYKITSFDSGHWVLPSMEYAPGVVSDTIPIDVGYSPFNRAQPYHDIKDIIAATPADQKKQWWWYAVGGGIILVLLSYFLLRKKKAVAVSTPVIMVDPYEEAVRRLNHLQQEKGSAKNYHSALTDIFRMYVFRKKGILSLQKTTDDLILQLKDSYLGREQFDQLSQALRLSDFVKFAKFVPSAIDDARTFAEIKNAINAIQKTHVTGGSVNE